MIYNMPTDLTLINDHYFKEALSGSCIVLYRSIDHSISPSPGQLYYSPFSLQLDTLLLFHWENRSKLREYSQAPTVSTLSCMCPYILILPVTLNEQPNFFSKACLSFCVLFKETGLAVFLIFLLMYVSLYIGIFS